MMKDKEYIKRLRQIGWRNNFPPKATEEQIEKARQSAWDTWNAISYSVKHYPNNLYAFTILDDNLKPLFYKKTKETK